MNGPVQSLVSRLHAKRCGKGWIARCPAHDDNSPSLRINEGADGRALVKCWAGCSLDAVLSAIGLTTKDLFPVRPPPKSSRNGESPASTPTITPSNWETCVDALTEKHIEQLATWRGYSIEFCRWLKDNRVVGLYEGRIAFPVNDRALLSTRHKDRSARDRRASGR
jgi:hypothetical protein